MALPNSNFQLIAVYFALLLLPVATSVYFNFPDFNSNRGNITFDGDASSSNRRLQLTKNVRTDGLNQSVGRATFEQPVRLWDNDTGDVADFLTHFTFKITADNYSSTGGDGMAFFIGPFPSKIPKGSLGGLLGLFSNDNDSKESSTVAVEFDTFPNKHDPSAPHVGIDVNSIVSKTYVYLPTNEAKLTEARLMGNANVSYNSSTKNLSVFLTCKTSSGFFRNYTLSYILDLKKILPDRVAVGFSASTGDLYETHEVISWDFASTLEVNDKKGKKPGEVNDKQGKKPGEVNDKNGKKPGLIIGLAVGFGLLACGIAISWSICKRKKAGQEEAEDIEISMDNEFKKETGPKRFTRRELSHATNNFAEGVKLGEGGFGGVYKGLLSNSNAEVAVKRVSRESKQGKKEYVSEVKIISCLRHEI